MRRTHRTPECIGCWTPQHVGGNLHLVCRECGAVRPSFAEDHEGAILMNFLDEEPEQPKQQWRSL